MYEFHPIYCLFSILSFQLNISLIQQKNSTEERSTRVIFDLQSRTSRFSSVLLSSQPNGLYRPATRVSSLGDRESVHRNLSTATQFDALELDLISPMLNNNWSLFSHIFGSFACQISRLVNVDKTFLSVVVRYKWEGSVTEGEGKEGGRCRGRR